MGHMGRMLPLFLRPRCIIRPRMVIQSLLPTTWHPSTTIYRPALSLAHHMVTDTPPLCQFTHISTERRPTQAFQVAVPFRVECTIIMA